MLALASSCRGTLPIKSWVIKIRLVVWVRAKVGFEAGVMRASRGSICGEIKPREAKGVAQRAFLAPEFFE